MGSYCAIFWFSVENSEQGRFALFLRGRILPYSGAWPLCQIWGGKWLYAFEKTISLHYRSVFPDRMYLFAALAGLRLEIGFKSKIICEEFLMRAQENSLGRLFNCRFLRAKIGKCRRKIGKFGNSRGASYWGLTGRQGSLLQCKRASNWPKNIVFAGSNAPPRGRKRAGRSQTAPRTSANAASRFPCVGPPVSAAVPAGHMGG